MTELDFKVPPAELVDVDRLQVDQDNPNRMSARQFKALKKTRNYLRSALILSPNATASNYIADPKSSQSTWITAKSTSIALFSSR